MQVPLVLQRINSIMARHPWLSAVTITSTKTTAADWIVQTYIEKRETYDRRRGLVFFCFGFIYQGSCQYFMFNHIMEHFWPTKNQTFRAALYKVGLANIICDPMFFFPTFYYMREALNTDDWSRASFYVGLNNYKANCFTDWYNSWKIWIPGFGVTFFIMPKHLRLPWMSLLSFVYCIILSITRGDRQAELNAKSQETRKMQDQDLIPTRERITLITPPQPEGPEVAYVKPKVVSVIEEQSTWDHFNPVLAVLEKQSNMDQPGAELCNK